MTNTAKRNLKNPQGAEGFLMGMHMAQENYEVNLWAVDMLHVKPEDHILEVGFGPGVATEEMAKRVTTGHIMGIDYSEIMLNQAKKRNDWAIQQGRVDLRHANVNELPDFNKAFDKIVAINNVMYWENQPEVLLKLKQTLKPGGFIALVLQRGEDQLKAGGCNDEIGFYIQCLNYAGFANANVCIQPVLKPEKKYSKATRKMGLTWEKESPAHQLAGICIYGHNPIQYETMAEYYQAMHAYHASQRQMSLLRPSAMDFLFNQPQ